MKIQFLLRLLHVISFVGLILSFMYVPKSGLSANLIGTSSMLLISTDFASIIFRVPMFSSRKWFESSKYTWSDTLGLIIHIIIASVFLLGIILQRNSGVVFEI